MMEIQKYQRLFGVLLGIALCSGPSLTLAADTCPWKETGQGSVCARWESLMQRLQAAQAHATAGQPQTLANKPSPGPQSSKASPEEARARGIIDYFLENLTPPIPDLGGLKINPGYNLIQEDNGYTAQFPKAAWTAESLRIDFGPLSFHIEPQEGGLSSVDFRFGNLITFHENHQVLSHLLIGHQKNQGIWDDTLKNFAQAESRLTEINLIIPNKPVMVGIGSLDINQALTRADNDNWSQQQNLELADLNAQLDNNAVKLQRMIGQISLDGRDYRQVSKLNTRFRDLLEEEMDKSEASEKRFLEFVSGIYDLFTRFDLNLITTGLAVTTPGQPLTKIERLTLGSHLDEGQGNKGSNLNYTFEMSGLQTPTANIPAGLAPTDARLEIGWSDIPPRLFSQMVDMSMASEEMSEEEREAYLNQRLAELILKSHLGMYIKDSFIAAPDARMDINFKAAIDSKAAMGGTGTFNLRMQGLQKVLDQLGELPEQQAVSGFLAMLVALSNRTEENGKVIDRFDLKLSEEGKLWLNGKDVTGLFIQPEAQDKSPQAPEKSE
jgi:hypothetical protein